MMISQNYIEYLRPTIENLGLIYTQESAIKYLSNLTGNTSHCQILYKQMFSHILETVSTKGISLKDMLF